MPIRDKFEKHAPSAVGPIVSAETITPDDKSDLSHVTRVLHVGIAGDIRVTMADGTTVTFANLASGWHPMRVTRIWATGTTAASIVGGW